MKINISENVATKEPQQTQSDPLAELINTRITNLRPRLLDISRRNPLINPKLSPRSNSHIQVVDELPEVLFKNMASQEKMRLRPLPSLEEDPIDENTRKFQDALSNARATDEEYLAALKALDDASQSSKPQTNDTEQLEPTEQTNFKEVSKSNFAPRNSLRQSLSTDKDGLGETSSSTTNKDLEATAQDLEDTHKIERRLKDKVRKALNMPPRQHQKTTASLPEHARNNGVSPSYDLPLPEEQHSDGRHTDKDIQTLQLPDDLDRKLTKIISTCNSWAQETGLNVLYSAYGFLEWKDPSSNETCFAPLILLPVSIEKERTRRGTEYWVNGIEEEGEINTVLREKLKEDFGIKLPEFTEGNLEAYFSEVSSLAPTNIPLWRVRRQIVFGVFPSARIAMYHDLDTDSHSFHSNSAISQLLGGSSATGISLYGDEYSTDDPEVEKKLPCLVMDADSSQFSTIVDVMDGKHLAVEGPPGTGKSQTIVNTIAAALDSGKKVLFVAEKLAALDVVKSRLEQVGLGEYVLALQADKASRERVFDSIRQRVDLSKDRSAKELADKKIRFKDNRNKLYDYINTLTSPVGNTGLNVYEVLGKAIRTNEILAPLPAALKKPTVPNIGNFSRHKIEIAVVAAKALTATWERTQNAKHHWRNVQITNLDKFKAEKLSDAAQLAADKLKERSKVTSKLQDLGANPKNAIKIQANFIQELELLGKDFKNIDTEFVTLLSKASDTKQIHAFSSLGLEYHNQKAFIQNQLDTQAELPSSENFQNLEALCRTNQLNKADHDEIKQLLKTHLEKIEAAKILIASVKTLTDKLPQAQEWQLATLQEISTLISKFTAKTLQLRTSIKLDQLTGAKLRAISKQGKALREKREELTSSLYIARAPEDLDTLLSHVSALKNAGILSFLSPAVKAAKNAYATLSKGNTYNKSIAIHELNELIDWKQSTNNFLTDDKVKASLGNDVDLNANFEQLEEVANFLETVEEQFPKDSEAEINALLKEGHLELLRLIPNQIDTEWHELNYSLAKTKLEELEQTVIPLQKLNSLLESHFPNLPAIKNLNLNDLGTLFSEVTKLEDIAQRLDASDDISPLTEKWHQGHKTDHLKLSQSLAFVEKLKTVEENIPSIFSHIKEDRLPNLIDTLNQFASAQAAYLNSLNELATLASVEASQLDLPLNDQEAISHLEEAAKDTEGLYAHADFRYASKELQDHGLSWVANALLKDHHPLTNLAEIVESVIYLAMAKFVYEEHSKILSLCPGRKLNECRQELAILDREIIILSRNQLRLKLLAKAEPPEGVSIGRKSDYTEMALIRNELAKKKRFISVRELTRRAKQALLEIKPCWMMSPLAVAQYLPKGQEVFDLVIIDEASQMPPENALGALARARQSMIVGDTNQLPPSNFFQKMLNVEEDDEDETVLEESVLELANSAFRPARRLKWHYRSKHSGLINFSNQMIYNGDLVVFPGPSEQQSDLGVSLVEVYGCFNSGVNDIEAEKMVNAAISFMKTHPERSLGIVTVNQKQRDLIIERMEHAISQDNHAARYIERWQAEKDGLEQFFIKNLENVQGDERDVIFIGTVYGPPKLGLPTPNRFGPINGPAGRRRLNVLFSRAKLQIVTFTSMKSTDIKADESQNAGAYLLKRWLEYSATGQLHGGTFTNRNTDSDFEDYVIQQIRAMGCEAEPQVGVAGYFIDIGVKHPDWPHGFILAVECDGASYHTAKSARDRDRLRQEVLEGLGWRFHRIWSTDWFNDPRQQAEILRSVITQRVEELKRKTAEHDVAANKIRESSIGSSNRKLNQLHIDFQPQNQETSQADSTTSPEASPETEAQDTDRVENLPAPSSFTTNHEAEENDDEECLYDLSDSAEAIIINQLEELSAGDISNALLSMLKDRPSRSCATASIMKGVLRWLNLPTEGFPRQDFQRRVTQEINNLTSKGLVEKYHGENERVRLV